ncbi:MAG TPA: hypothetical protein VG328_04135 [Stellaceae bacterium]|jgi:hypothetical protein|nr:hypothetical protein [Stellaceae bacterium]
MLPHTAANDPKHYRGLALEARRAAETLTDSKAREHMFACAEAYERLAKLAERPPVTPLQPDAATSG